jgi:hypothetical protein
VRCEGGRSSRDDRFERFGRFASSWLQRVTTRSRGDEVSDQFGGNGREYILGGVRFCVSTFCGGGFVAVCMRCLWIFGDLNGISSSGDRKLGGTPPSW